MSEDLLYRANKFINKSKKVISTEKVITGDSVITNYGVSFKNIYSDKYFIDASNKVLESIDDTHKSARFYVNGEMKTGTITFDGDDISAISIPINSINDSIHIISIDFKLPKQSYSLNSSPINYIPSNQLYKILNDAITVCNITFTKFTPTYIQEINQSLIEDEDTNSTNNAIPTMAKVNKMIDELSSDTDASLRIYKKELVGFSSNKVAYMTYKRDVNDVPVFLLPSTNENIFTATFKCKEAKTSSIIVYGLVNTATDPMSAVVNGITMPSASITSVPESEGIPKHIVISNVELEKDNTITINSHFSDDTSAIQLYGYTVNNHPTGMLLSIGYVMIDFYGGAIRVDNTTTNIMYAGMLRSQTSDSSKDIHIAVSDVSNIITVQAFNEMGTGETVSTPFASKQIKGSGNTDEKKVEFIAASIYENQLYVMVDNYIDDEITDDIDYANDEHKHCKVFVFMVSDTMTQLCEYEVRNDDLGIRYLGDKFIALNTKNIPAYSFKDGDAKKIMIDDKRTITLSAASTCTNSAIFFDNEDNLYDPESKTVYTKHCKRITFNELDGATSIASYGPYVFVCYRNKQAQSNISFFKKEYRYKYLTKYTIANNNPVSEPGTIYFDY